MKRSEVTPYSWSQMPPDSNTPATYEAGSDYNPSTSIPQHITLTHCIYAGFSAMSEMIIVATNRTRPVGHISHHMRGYVGKKLLIGTAIAGHA
jgi:hypothetical protein